MVGATVHREAEGEVREPPGDPLAWAATANSSSPPNRGRIQLPDDEVSNSKREGGRRADHVQSRRPVPVVRGVPAHHGLRRPLPLALLPPHQTLRHGLRDAVDEVGAGEGDIEAGGLGAVWSAVCLASKLLRGWLSGDDGDPAGGGWGSWRREESQDTGERKEDGG